METGASSGDDTSASGCATTGASFAGVTVTRNTSLAVRSPSLAVTRISKLPLKSAGGVPVKVVPSKPSQDGSALPSASVAE